MAIQRLVDLNIKLDIVRQQQMATLPVLMIFLLSWRLHRRIHRGLNGQIAMTPLQLTSFRQLLYGLEAKKMIWQIQNPYDEIMDHVVM